MLKLTFYEEPTIRLVVNDEPVKRLSIPGQIIISPEEYHGGYTVTPGTTAQILHTKEKQLTEDITVEPIPNNYGLITWNGSTLTVS